MRSLVIAYSIMKDDVLRFGTQEVSFILLERSVHEAPEKMKAAIQKEIFAVYAWEGYIIPGYGVCSHGIISYISYKDNRHIVVICPVHHLIGLFLGSKIDILERIIKYQLILKEHLDHLLTYLVCLSLAISGELSHLPD